MTIDLTTLKEQIDLRDLAAHYTTLTGTGKEQKGPCPRCGGKDRFYCRSQFFACRHCHPRRGDVVEFIMWVEEVDFRVAVDRLTAGRPPTLADPPAPRPPRPTRPPLVPPSQEWQARAAAFIQWAQGQLWQPTGRAGLDYLIGRGLTEATIKAAALGYNPKDITDHACRWGLTDRSTVWLPGPGIVIPWLIDGQPQRVNIRLLRPRLVNGQELKYIGPPGWAGANPLYRADDISPRRPVILVEGEFCALTITQEAGDLIIAAATGSKDSAQAGRWLARLAAAPLVLIALDAETDKGDLAARRWLTLLPNARRWRPLLKDPGDMHRAGLSVRQWIQAALPVSSWVDPDIARLISAGLPDTWPWRLFNPATGQWMTFDTPAELLAAADCLRQTFKVNLKKSSCQIDGKTKA